MKFLPNALIALAALALSACSTAQPPEPEFRALWVDAFRAGIKTPSQVSQLVAEARAGNFNAVIVQIRKRGDAYYNSLYEPKASDISSSFDPLADLVAKAHNTQAGPRIEVHAWIVTYHIWNSQNTAPPQPSHPYNLHPDWLTENSSGEQWEGTNYGFDPSHPEVQRHTFNVAMDIINRYDIDGFHFDYIRYPGREWGYHPIAIERFNALHDRTGRPAPSDPLWMEFRRNQVTDLVRKVYLSAAASKPQVKISAATITWAPGIVSTGQWQNSAAYLSVLQDWRAWMEEGIIDLNIPMAYFRETTHAVDYDAWNIFTKDHQYNRRAVIGIGAYLNSVLNVMDQMLETRDRTRQGHNASGLALYSYGVPTSDNVSRSAFLNALTEPSSLNPGADPIFPTSVPTPEMPWKSAPAHGHIKGLVRDQLDQNKAVEFVTVEISGPVNRTATSDATGFFGSVDLPPGDYTLRVQHPERRGVVRPFVVAAGLVTDLNVLLAAPEEPFFADLGVSPGATAALISWRPNQPGPTWIEWSALGSAPQRIDPSKNPAGRFTSYIASLTPGAEYSFVIAQQTSDQTLRSEPVSVTTAGERVVDDPVAAYSGTWTPGSASSDKYGSSYRFSGVSASGTTATAVFDPQLQTPGLYDVYVWYPQGGNRSTRAPHVVHSDGGDLTRLIDQTSGGGRWNLLIADRLVQDPASARVELRNDTGESSGVVMADAVRWVYNPAQDSAPDDTPPLWWTRHFGITDAGTDGDGDGYSAGQEYMLGLDPSSSGSILRTALSIEPGAGVALRFWPYHADRDYSLEFLDELSHSSWTRVEADLAILENGEAKLIHDAPPTGAGFYRLRVERL